MLHDKLHLLWNMSEELINSASKVSIDDRRLSNGCQYGGQQYLLGNRLNALLLIVVLNVIDLYILHKIMKRKRQDMSFARGHFNIDF